MPETAAETWKPIPFAPGYDVSDLGRVRSWRRQGGGCVGISHAPLILRPDIHQFGYHVFSLSIDSIKRKFYVHRLVAFAFIGEPPTGMNEARHYDGDPSNNAPANLRWGTHADNMQDRTRHGRSAVGEVNPKAKLTTAEVQKVFELRDSGLTQKAIGRELGVCQSHVSRILLRKLWKSVETQEAGAA